MNPKIIPRSGEMTMKATIFITPLVTIEPGPALTRAAPTRPPTSVCEELEGNPHHHVSRFQVIAAMSAAAITDRLSTSGSTTPFPIVAATFRGKIVNAIKLKKAAMETAAKGERTLVDTTVAIEFAESWNPLIKSNTRTNPTIIYKNVICSLFELTTY